MPFVEFWNHRAADYDVDFDSAPIRLAVLARMQELLRLPRGGTLVDLGTGTGEALLRLTPPWAGRAIGIDFSPDMLAVAGSKLSRGNEVFQLVQADLTSLPIPSDSADVIVSSMSLHHLPDAGKARALAEIRRTIKDGGQIIIGDEMFFFPTGGLSPSDIRARMFRAYYPSLSYAEAAAKFTAFDEWPIEAPRLAALVRAAGFDVELIEIGPMAGIIHGTVRPRQGKQASLPVWAAVPDAPRLQAPVGPWAVAGQGGVT